MRKARNRIHHATDDIYAKTQRWVANANSYAYTDPYDAPSPVRGCVKEYLTAFMRVNSASGWVNIWFSILRWKRGEGEASQCAQEVKAAPTLFIALHTIMTNYIVLISAVALAWIFKNSFTATWPHTVVLASARALDRAPPSPLQIPCLGVSTLSINKHVFMSVQDCRCHASFALHYIIIIMTPLLITPTHRDGVGVGARVGLVRTISNSRLWSM